MNTDALANAIEKVEKANRLDLELLAQSIGAMKKTFPDEDFSDAESLMRVEATEAVLHLVEEHLPEWTITLKGRADETDGDWHCFLRRTDARDNDAVIGSGSGPRLSLAVLAAVLKASILRARL